MPGRIVFPLTMSNRAALAVKTADFRHVLHYNEFAFELGFVVTFHKCQGKTMGKVVLDLNRLPGRGFNLTYSSLYVGLSRVRRGADVRLFPALTEGALNYLTRLRVKPELSTWLLRFDSQGVWQVSNQEARLRKLRNAEEVTWRPSGEVSHHAMIGPAAASSGPAQAKRRRKPLKSSSSAAAATMPAQAPGDRSKSNAAAAAAHAAAPAPTRSRRQHRAAPARLLDDMDLGSGESDSDAQRQ